MLCNVYPSSLGCSDAKTSERIKLDGVEKQTPSQLKGTVVMYLVRGFQTRQMIPPLNNAHFFFLTYNSINRRHVVCNL